MFGQLIVHPRFPLYPTIEKSMRKHNLSESKKCYPYLIRARKKYTATDPNEVIVGGIWSGEKDKIRNHATVNVNCHFRVNDSASLVITYLEG